MIQVILPEFADYPQVLHALARLGMKRSTLIAKMEKLGIVR